MVAAIVRGVAGMGRSASARNVGQLASARRSGGGTIENLVAEITHPVRIGEHDQSAFGLGLMLDYARTAGNEEFAKLVSDSAKKFFLADKNCPLAYEPSGEDFLSPSLGEADVMRRVGSNAPSHAINFFAFAYCRRR